MPSVELHKTDYISYRKFFNDVTITVTLITVNPLSLTWYQQQKIAHAGQTGGPLPEVKCWEKGNCF